MKLSLLSIGLLAGAVAASPTPTSDNAAIVKRASLDDVSFYIF
jgi:hypothetical protein